MATLEADLKSIRDNYIAALKADSLNPLPDYSLDGESVSRDAWRSSLLQKIHDLNRLIAAEEPFEIRTHVY